MTDTKTTDQGEDFGADRAEFLPTWDFAKTPTFTGTITDRETVHDVASQLSGEIRDVDLYTLVSDGDGQPYTVWGSGMLARVLPRHVGHHVKITDKGLKQQTDKTQLRVYEVRCATCTAEGR